MCQVRFIGCLHLGHKWMAQHRGFTDEVHHDEHLIDQWNRTVHKKDLTYILGDVTMETSEHYYQLDRLAGRKIVVLGNHDMPKDTRKLLEYVETVAGMVYYKGFALSHCPIHPNEISFYRGNIHAHIHENLLNEVIITSRYGEEQPGATLFKYHNVDALRIGFRPRTLDEILNTTDMN